MSTMSCGRASELLSDHVEGNLDGVLYVEVDAHLAACPDCRALRAALVEVTGLLRVAATVEPSAGLADRVARASWTVARRPAPVAAPVRRPLAWAHLTASGVAWLTEVPFAVQAIAAGFALVLTAGLVMAAGAPPGAHARPRVTQRFSEAAVYVVERKDRLVEDFRLLRIVIATAFEGRLDRVNDRVDDYRRLLERRRKDEERKEQHKKSEALESASRWAGALGPTGETFRTRAEAAT